MIDSTARDPSAPETTPAEVTTGTAAATGTGRGRARGVRHGGAQEAGVTPRSALVIVLVTSGASNT